MRNVKSGVRIVNAKQKCPLLRFGPFSFSRRKTCCGTVGLWSRGARVWAAGGQRAAERPIDGHSAERVVHGLPTRPEGRFFWDTIMAFFWDTHHRTFFGTPIGTPTTDVTHRWTPTHHLNKDTHRCWDTHRHKDTHPAPCPNHGFVLIATFWTLAAMAVLASLSGHPRQQCLSAMRPIWDTHH